MPTGDSGNLEKKVDLLLALALDERVWPEGDLPDVADLLRRLGIDLRFSDELRSLLRQIGHLDNPYFLSRRWVGERLEQVVERLKNLEQALETLSSSTREQMSTAASGNAKLSTMERTLGELKDATDSAGRQNRELGEMITKLAVQYTALQTGLADVRASLTDLQSDLRKTAGTIEELNTAVAKSQG